MGPTGDNRASSGAAESAGSTSASSPVARLTIRRTSPEDIKERELYASVDGKKVAILRFGEEVTVTLAPGRHEVRVHNTWSRKKAEFDAAPGQHVRFTTVNVPGKGFALWAVFVGAALMWTVLEREEDGPPTAG
jgi:hypothetical protein